MPEPQSLYCPSAAGGSTMQYGAMSSDSKQGGWPKPDKAPPTFFVSTPYHNRTTLHGTGLGSKPLTLKDDPNITAYSDAWTRKTSLDDVTGDVGLGSIHHVVGYNAAYLDGSCEWKQDGSRSLIFTAVSIQNHEHPEFEAIWTTFFDR